METARYDFMDAINLNDKVGVAGDWHGNSAWAAHAIEKFHEQGMKAIMHLGDFGVWPGPSGRKYLFWVNKTLKKHDMYLFVTLGNHEDYNQVQRFQKVDELGDCVFAPNHDRIIFFPRAFSWSWNDHTFMSFGGANSIDKDRRKPDKSWWEQEQISDNDVETGISVGKADVIFAHDAPYGVDIIGSHRSSLPLHIELYAHESRKQLKKVTDVLQPSVFFHGHYHVYRDNMDTLRVDGEAETYQMRSIGLDKEYSHYNMGILNTKSLDFKIFS